ncbi:MAG: response regulator [Candidatus Omnitrophica bacterium]|nr:response regulator [Candidatus Omnitrophota bacterium]
MNNNSKEKPRILLVDDDKDMCESLADVLTLDTDFQVDHTTSPTNAIDRVRQQDYDLVILDYKMPEMNGIELLERLKNIRQDLTAFILTAFISHDLIEQAKELGASRVLSKFIWPDEILKSIKKVLDR